jgi:hypothetical protein
LLEISENVGPGLPQLVFCMGVQRAGAGLLRHHSGRLSQRRPQKPVFAIRLDRTLSVDAKVQKPNIPDGSRNREDVTDPQKLTRPGVIRTHDQGIMSGDEPEE